MALGSGRADGHAIAVLAAWSVVFVVAAVRTFRWE